MNVLAIGGAMVDTIVTIASDKIEQMKMRNAESSFLLLDGAFIAKGSDLYFREAPRVVAEATTGAGDAFSATFTCYHSKTEDVVYSLSAAVLNVASVVKFIDTQARLLTYSALENELEDAAAAPLYNWSI